MAAQSRRVVFAACFVLAMVVAAEARIILGKPDGVGKPDDKGNGKPEWVGKPDHQGKPDDKGKPDETNKDKGQGKGPKGKCGKLNGTCCEAPRKTCTGNLMCSVTSSRCERCGGVGEQCCSGTTSKGKQVRACRGDSVCDNNVCVAVPEDDGEDEGPELPKKPEESPSPAPGNSTVEASPSPTP